jgi:hypothetical protein
MASESLDRPVALSRELIALIDVVSTVERERTARLDAKLAELAERMREADRVLKLIAGGAATREARLRALEDMVEAMAAERSHVITPRPLDIPARPGFDPAVIDMRGRNPEPRD